MKKLLLFNILIATFSLNSSAQCVISDQPSSPSQGSICEGGQTDVNTANSESGIYYYLRNDATNNVIDGPLLGNGNPLVFNTGMLNSSAMFNIYAAKAEQLTGKYIKLGTPTNNKSYIDIPNTSSLQLNENWTLEAWVVPNGSQDNMIETYNGAGGYALRVLNGKFVAYAFYSSSSYITVTSITNATAGVWTHVAATFNETTDELKIYVNGVLDATNSAATIDQRASSTSIKLGGRGDIGTPVDWFLMDEARIWNVERTASEIQYGKTHKLLGNEPGLMAYYDFNTVVYPNTTIEDLTSNNNNGTMLGYFAAGEVVVSTEQVLSPSDTCNMEMSSIISVDVIPEKTNTINDTICNDESIIVNGTIYDLNNPSGIEIFTNIGPANCDSTVSISLTVNPAIDISVTNSSPTLTANQSGATYQWLNCDNNYAIIPSETSQNFTANNNGNYAVKINNNGCVDTSSCVNVTTVGIQQYNTTQMNISPNPVLNTLSILTKETLKEVSIYTINGSLIKSINNNFNAISVSELSKGMYILVIQSEKGITQSKFIKE